MVGEARRPRRQARGARVRVAAAAAAAGATALLLACAFAADPPGGPPRTIPPKVLRVEPESGAVLATPPARAEIDFDEVINEQITSPQRDIQGAVLLSPVSGKVSVDWHRNRLTIEPKGGFQPGRIYRLELLPVITDLHQNRLKQGKLVVFSTGPEIPAARLRGTVVDWIANHAATGALVEALLLPDSLPYLAVADSAGSFTMPQMPAGEYLVYGIVDQNGNRKRDPREAFDTARVTLQDTASVGLFAFTHDTLGPRIRSMEIADSLTLRLTFDRPLDPAQAPDTSMVLVRPADDTTRTVAVAALLTPAGYDSLTKAAAAARDTAQRARAARDTTAGKTPGAAAPAPARAPAVTRAGAPPLAAAPAARPPGGRAAERAPDTTVAMRMLLRRPTPTDKRLLRLVEPLHPGSRYQVAMRGVRGLTGVVGPSQPASILVPKPPPPRPASRADSLRRAAARADTLHAPAPGDTTRVRPDTTRGRGDSTPPQPRPDSIPPRPDSVPARPDSTRPAAPPRPPASRR